MKLKIKELREECRITQKELAEKLNNVQRNVSNWENGTSEPDCETIVKIADIFGVSLDELFGRYGNDYKQAVYTEEDYAILSLLRQLDGEQRATVLNLLKIITK